MLGNEGGPEKVEGGRIKRRREMIAAITATFEHAFRLI